MQVVVKCPECVESRVRPDDVTIRHCVEDETWSYRFVCPMCRRPAVAPTSAPAAIDALAAGCVVERWHLPAELLEHPDGPPLTLADLHELHTLLADPDWFDALERVSREGSA